MPHQPSYLEIQFSQMWVDRYPDIDLHSEYKFSKSRRFKADFAHIEARVLIEIQGAVWGGKSGHNSGSGIIRDAEKLNLASSEGWVMFFLPDKLITKEQLEAIAATIKTRLAEKSVLSSK